jgi:integrase
MSVIDIHQYDQRYERATRAVIESTLSATNKRLIIAYRDACLLRQTCGKVRLIRALQTLKQLGDLLEKDFDHAGRDDVERLLGRLLERQPPYTAATMATTKAVLKRFLTFVSNPHDFPRTPAPPSVAWMTVHVRTRDHRRLQRHDLLLPSDITRAIATTHNPRDRSFLGILWESGGRIGEIGNLQRKHVTPTAGGYHLDLTGKTGQRSVLIVKSAAALTEWLQHHPDADPDAPLWQHYQYRAQRAAVCYRTLNKIIKIAFTRAGITKRVYPHIFRHSRATYVLATGLMNEAQAKVYFGWTPGSTILANYAHLLASDANNAILRENHIAPAPRPESESTGIPCPSCGQLNPVGVLCTRCDPNELHHAAPEAVLQQFAQLLADHGLLDDAARIIHQTGLGATLKRMADAEERADQVTAKTRDE